MNHDQRTTLGAMLVGVAVIGAFLYAKSRDAAAATSSDTTGQVGDGHNPTANLLGADSTATHGSIADVRNALMPITSPFAADADPATIMAVIGVAQGQLHQLLLAGLGNANVDQREFAGLDTSDAAGQMHFSAAD